MLQYFTTNINVIYLHDCITHQKAILYIFIVVIIITLKKKLRHSIDHHILSL